MGKNSWWNKKAYEKVDDYDNLNRRLENLEKNNWENKRREKDKEKAYEKKIEGFKKGRGV